MSPRSIFHGLQLARVRWVDSRGMALIQPRQALRAWLARPAPSSSSPAPPVRAFHGFTPRDGRVLVSLWAPDANLNASEWLSGVNRQRRDWLRFCKRWAHTRTSSGSKGGRGTGFQSETHDDRDWLSRSEKVSSSRGPNQSRTYYNRPQTSLGMMASLFFCDGFVCT